MVQSLSGCPRQYPRSRQQLMIRYRHGEDEQCRRIMRRPFPPGLALCISRREEPVRCTVAEPGGSGREDRDRVCTDGQAGCPRHRGGNRAGRASHRHSPVGGCPGENGRAPHYEVVIVDNDPVTSATAALVAGRPEENLRYAREPRRGLAAAHNALEQRQVLALGPLAYGISRLRNRMTRYPAEPGTRADDLGQGRYRPGRLRRIAAIAADTAAAEQAAIRPTVFRGHLRLHHRQVGRPEAGGRLRRKQTGRRTR